jgi:excisionase family DNA binding protein
MSELLDLKQVTQLLHLDRVTIYRMLSEGRIKGFKIGAKWRFHKNEIDHLLGKENEPGQPENEGGSLADFPSECIQQVQEIFGGIIGIGALTVTLQGQTLTEPTYSNPFCQLMLSTPNGHHACQVSWQKIALQANGDTSFQSCHAGLCYLRSIIHDKEKPVGWLIAGQFYVNPPDHNEEQTRLEHLASKSKIQLSHLLEAKKGIPVLNSIQQEQVWAWTPRVANAFNSILYERSDLIDRLQRISELTSTHLKRN